ncbi:MAG: right-handed parallel beta-helix repeat-containing protein, partial [Chloroflexi bacterium]|nr:right-handed parallel beta-helix repeat-containing protein [Chloroflexota bacterium]
NGADLCGFAPASLRKPLVPQTEETELSVPGDYATIQEAIDAIAPGGTIAVAPGTYEVGLTIWKPLTLRGSGKDQTVLKPLPNPTRRLIISIVSEAEEVTLEGMEISGSKEEGLLIYGEAYLKDLQISGNGWDSILMGGFSQATISGSSFSENGYEGIDMWDSSQAAISGSSFFGNGGDGIRMKGSSRAIIFGSSFSRNFSGILMWESSQAIISDSSFSGNNDGIDMRD